MPDKYDTFLDSGGESVMTKYDDFLDANTKEVKKEPWLVENAPTIGSIIGGIAGGASGAASPIPGGMMAGSALGTALGTSIGSSGREIYRQLSEESAVKPQTTSQFLIGQGKDVAEQVAYDIAGNVIAKGLGKGYRALFPKEAVKIEAGAEEAQKLMQTHGASLTPGQIAPKSTVGRIEGTLQSGILSKGVIEGKYEAQDAALKSIRDSFLNVDRMSPLERGNIFIDAIKGGNKALDESAHKMYSELDVMAKQSGATVDVSPVKNIASDILKQQARIGNVGLTEQGGEVLNKVASGNKVLSFADAHALRSALLARGRLLEAGDPAAKNISDFVGVLNTQMEKGASVNPDLFNKYKNVSSFYKGSMQRLNDDYIKNLVKKNPEDIGAALYQSGNVTEINKAKIALRRAAALDKTIDYKTKVDSIKEGFIESLLTSRNKLTKEGETQGISLLKDFEDAKMKHTIDALLTPEYAAKLKTFAQASQMAQSRPTSVMPILTAMVQAGAVMSIGGYALGKGDPESIGLAAPIIIGPKVMAKLLIKPGMVDKLILASKAIPGQTPISKGFITKLVAEIVKENEDETSTSP